jgi:hypothetical protein
MAEQQSIEAYLNELCAALTVDSLRRDEIRLDIHRTLREQAEARQRKGVDPYEAEAQAVREFGSVVSVASRFNSKPNFLLPSQFIMPLKAAGIMLISLGFLWLSYGLALFNSIYFHVWRFEPLNRAVFLGRWAILLLLLVASGIGLMRLRRWAQWAGVFIAAFSFEMFFIFQNDLIAMNLYEPVSPLPGIPICLLSGFVLWTLLHPRYRKVPWM